MLAEVDIEAASQLGLRLPDGTEIYPPNNWHGFVPDTPEARKGIVDALTQSAANLGISPAELIANYKWVKRDVQKIITLLPGRIDHVRLDDPDLISAPETEADQPEPVDDVIDVEPVQDQAPD